LQPDKTRDPRETCEPGKTLKVLAMNYFYIPAKAIARLAFAVLLLSACSSEPQQTAEASIKPYLNLDEFTGLESLGDSVDSIQLDYALDSAKGGELPLKSCAIVNTTSETDVDQSQQHLLKLMKINCSAASYYFNALGARNVRSQFPQAINEDFVKSLPGLAVPDLGGDSMLNRDGTLAEVEPGFKVVAVSENAAEVELAGDLVVNYVLMARGDFDKDGYEDLLLRLDWYISTVFGKGFDLIMLSQTPDVLRPRITWRR